jgi:glycosyltransferase involved in cell wall biosynthesis
MRLDLRRPDHGEPGIVWVTRTEPAPHPYIIQSCRNAGVRIRTLWWDQPGHDRPRLGRIVNVGIRRPGRGYPMTLQLISPRLLVELARADEDVVVSYEFGLVGLYAVLSKLLRPRRKVICLVQADYEHLGRSGTARYKVVFRRLAARFVDVFVANNQPAKDYLLRVLEVPEDRIIVGWWLAGLPRDLAERAPEVAGTVPDGVPVFVCAAQLIPRKGIDLLLEAVATYQREFGPCRVWVIGDGPEKESLLRLARRLQVEDAVTFLGTVDRERLKGALSACDVFVFPTLKDFIGRAVVEALTAGVPVVVSPLTGAAETIVHHGVNGFIVDPHDRRAWAEAMHLAVDPETLRKLRAGVQETNASLTPDAAAEVVLQAAAIARGDTVASSTTPGISS